MHEMIKIRDKCKENRETNRYCFNDLAVPDKRIGTSSSLAKISIYYQNFLLFQTFCQECGVMEINLTVLGNCTVSASVYKSIFSTHEITKLMQLGGYGLYQNLTAFKCFKVSRKHG